MPLHWERHGSGEPLLFVTGFTISASVFEPLLDLYTRRFECLLYDHRGTGRSGRSLRPTSMPELAADAVDVLARMGVDSAHVYGLSMGGMVAQELAIRFPERVRGLVLGATTPGGPRALRPKGGEIVSLARGGLARALFSDEFRRDHPERVRELLPYFGRHRSRAAALMSQSLATVYHDTLSRLPLIQAPTLVLHGACDAMAPLGNARLLAERIPDAELRVVPGAGHAFPLERPEITFRLLTDWLDRRGPIAPGRPYTGLLAAGERFTRAFGLPVGAARTGASLAAAISDRFRGRTHVAIDG